VEDAGWIPLSLDCSSCGVYKTKESIFWMILLKAERISASQEELYVLWRWVIISKVLMIEFAILVYGQINSANCIENEARSGLNVHCLLP
jgi:hypothetical protein